MLKIVSQSSKQSVNALRKWSFSGSNLARSFSQERHGTTILAVRKDGKTVMGGDGQVSMGSTVVKSNARKVRKIGENILVGFAGSTADALTLLERLEGKLEAHPGQLMRACCELAKNWRMDKYLRRLDAVLLVADKNHIFEMTGNGDVLEPEEGVMAVGSGSVFAGSAAKALIDMPDISAEEIVKKSMKIAGDSCVYTSHHLTLETLTEETPEEGEEKKKE
jgi:ATP-dependent HslUV protease subunit HslV